MKKLSDAELTVMEVLWQKDFMVLGEIVDALKEKTKWSRNTVHTYLTRMDKKGFVYINKDKEPHQYSYLLSKEEYSQSERERLLHNIYQGDVGGLITAFLKESKITAEEKERLNKLLDEMEV